VGIGIYAHGQNQNATEDRQVTHDPEYSLLLSAYHVRDADELRRAAELGSGAR